jgi:hypothetical protein
MLNETFEDKYTTRKFGRSPAKIQGGVGLFAAIFFYQNTGAKKGFPLQSLTQHWGSISALIGNFLTS